MENPVGSWNVGALEREGSELQMNALRKVSGGRRVRC